MIITNMSYKYENEVIVSPMVTESRGEALNAVLNSVIRLWRLVTRATTPLIALIDDIHDQSRYVYVHMHTYTRTHTCNRQRVLMPARSSIMLIVLFKCLVLPISIIESDSCLKKNHANASNELCILIA